MKADYDELMGFEKVRFVSNHDGDVFNIILNDNYMPVMEFYNEVGSMTINLSMVSNSQIKSQSKKDFPILLAGSQYAGETKLNLGVEEYNSASSFSL